MEKEIIEGNKLIADFCMIERLEDHKYNFIEVGHVLGLKDNIDHGEWIKVSELKYHSSWDWLMPVVEKIESTNEVKIEDVFCEIVLNDGNGYCIGLIKKDAETKIEAVWLAVTEFIKWYNNQK